MSIPATLAAVRHAGTAAGGAASAARLGNFMDGALALNSDMQMAQVLSENKDAAIDNVEGIAKSTVPESTIGHKAI